LPVEYKGVLIDCSYRLDFVVAGKVVVEVKAVDTLLPVHEAQLLTYLKLTGCRGGLLINFNVPVLKNGIKRLVLQNQPSLFGQIKDDSVFSVPDLKIANCRTGC